MLTWQSMIYYYAKEVSRMSLSQIIEKVEENAQCGLVEDTMLPTVCGLCAGSFAPPHYPCKHLAEIFQHLGAVCLEPAEEPLVRVQLPEGWKLVPTDHPMHTNVVDADGVRRARVFLKNSLYETITGIWLI